MDALTLARIQFGFTVTFHIIFPTLSIGLALFLAICEGMWLRTRDVIYLDIYKFWLGIFAMTFGIGVVTGIVLSFEFGLGFSGFSQMAGPVIGPLIGLEVISSFFLEAGFLGIMLFGLNRVGPRTHFAATCLVSLGTTFSASWIMSANSWMQTPDGVVMQGGALVVVDWLRVIFNPSYLVRLPHMLIAAYLSAAFFIGGVAAIYLLQKKHLPFARRTLTMALAAISFLIGAQSLFGTMIARVYEKAQPGKLLAIEGFWNDRAAAPYNFIITPDEAKEVNGIEIGIPYLDSILVTHSMNGTVPGLKNVPSNERPMMAPVFYAFRLMFVIAIAMVATAAVGLWLKYQNCLFTSRWYLKWFVSMLPSGVVATIGGWYVAEMGRQPYVIYGLLRTADAVSPVATGPLIGSLSAFIVVYSLFLAAFCTFVWRLIRNGPADSPAASPLAGPLKRALMQQPVSSGLSPFAAE